MTGEIAARFEDREFFIRDGLKLHFRDYPGGPGKPPLLCLHGLTRNARDFADFAARYSPRFRVIALDFRGRGESDYDPVPLRYNPLTYAADVIELLDQHMIEQAVFVGTSLGGLVTMTVAAIEPQRIAAAILNDIGPELDGTGLDRIKIYVGRDVRFNSWEEAAASIAAYNRNIPASYTQGDWVRMAHRVCREEKGMIRFDYDMPIALPFQTGNARPTVDMWPMFKTLGEKPLLVVHGELSDLLTAASLARMHDAVPSMISVTLPGVGHAPELDEPKAIAAIDAFLDKIDR